MESIYGMHLSFLISSHCARIFFNLKTAAGKETASN